MNVRRGGGDGARVVLAGGTSEIGLAIVRELQRGSPREVLVMGRDLQALERAAEELRGAGCARVIVGTVRAEQLEHHGEAVREGIARLGGVDIAIVAVGVLGERGGMPRDLDAAAELLRVNVVGAGSLLLRLAGALREAGGGDLVVLSSVAAQRPRRANVVYGASKAGLDALARGLGEALQEEGVRVLVVRPGFVRTRMTRGLQEAPLSTSPQVVARAVVKGLRRNAHVVWAPAALRPVMAIVSLLPRGLARRINR